MAEGPRVGPGLRLLPAVRHGPKATEKQAGPRDLYQAAPASHRKGPPSFPTWTQVSLPSFLPLQPLGLAASSRTRTLYAGPSRLPSPQSLPLLQPSARGVRASGGARLGEDCRRKAEDLAVGQGSHHFISISICPSRTHRGKGVCPLTGTYIMHFPPCY